MPKHPSIPSEPNCGRHTPIGPVALARPSKKAGDRQRLTDAIVAALWEILDEELQPLRQATVKLTAENLRLHQAIVEPTELQRAARPNRGVPLIHATRTKNSHGSPREREVYPLLAKSNKEISSALNIAEGTVRFHVGNITRKLGRPRKEMLAKNWLERQ